MKASEITPLFVRENYIQPFGTSNDSTDPLSDGEGNVVQDGVIQTHIAGSIADAEKKLGTFLSKKTVKTNPQLRAMTAGTDYDVEAQPITYNQHDSMRFSELHLRHRNIISVDNIELWHASQKIGVIPLTWVVIKARKEGIIHLVPLGGGVLINEITFLGVGVRSYFFRDRVPGFWSVDYKCGIDELPLDAGQ